MAPLADTPGQKHRNTPLCTREAGALMLSNMQVYGSISENQGPVTRTFVPPCKIHILQPLCERLFSSFCLKDFQQKDVCQ